LCLTVLGTTPAAVCAAPEQWPESPHRTVLETPYGTLAVRPSDYLYSATLTFNHTPTTPRMQGILNIPYAYVVGRRQMALVSLDSGQTSCPIRFYWVVISERGYHITEPFGSCSSDIRMSAKGRLLRMETPDPADPGKLDIWEFDGRKIRRIGPRPQPAGSADYPRTGRPARPPAAG
jgi:hypothetical protein